MVFSFLDGGTDDRLADDRLAAPPDRSNLGFLTVSLECSMNTRTNVHLYIHTFPIINNTYIIHFT